MSVAEVDPAALERYYVAAFEAGVPRDQLENFLVAGIILSPKQLLASAMARLCDLPDGPTRIGFGGARGGGKLLPLDCPVATPEGWTTMGEIQDGDKVLGMDGKPTMVLKAHEVDMDPDAWEVVFDTGEVFRCDSRHLWVTETKKERVSQHRRTEHFRKKRRERRPSRAVECPKRPNLTKVLQDLNSRRTHDYLEPENGRARSTWEILETLVLPTGEVNHSVRCCQPLELPKAALAVEPYLFGIWLGDGHRNTGFIGMMDSDWEQVLPHIPPPARRSPDNRKSAPYSTVVVAGLKHGLAELGVLHKKRIPVCYLRASVEQRLSLMQGIMDTDGHATRSGQCEIGFSDYDLMSDTLELLSSLGVKATITSKTAWCKGKDCGPTWRIKFVSSMPMFRLSRKLQRQQTKISDRATRRYIVDVRKAAPEPMRCITVSNESGTYLVGKSLVPTHNSAWAVAQCAADDCQRCPGLKVLILRRVGKSNEENFESLRQAMLHDIPHNWVGGRGTLTFDNGSVIRLGHFQRESDIDAYLGLEYDVIVIEEATTLSAAKIENIETCLRTSKPDWRPRMYLTTNPGGESTAYFKETYVLPYRKGEEKDTRYIPATVDDNPYVNTEYVAVLDRLSGWQYDAWRRGDWDAAVGQFFTTFREEIHVIPYYKCPEDWEAWMALDYGFTHYTAVGLYRRDGDGNIYKQREYGARKTLPENHAKAIKKMLQEEGLTLSSLRIIVSGSDSFAKRNQGRTVSEDYREHGIFLQKADTDRVGGAAELLRLLGDDDPHEEGLDPIPATFFIMDCCKRTIEQIPAMVHDPARPEDVLKVNSDEKGRGGDDFYDETRYAAMAGRMQMTYMTTTEVDDSVPADPYEYSAPQPPTRDGMLVFQAPKGRVQR